MEYMEISAGRFYLPCSHKYSHTCCFHTSSHTSSHACSHGQKKLPGPNHIFPLIPGAPTRTPISTMKSRLYRPCFPACRERQSMEISLCISAVKARRRKSPSNSRLLTRGELTLKQGRSSVLDVRKWRGTLAIITGRESWCKTPWIWNWRWRGWKSWDASSIWKSGVCSSQRVRPRQWLSRLCTGGWCKSPRETTCYGRALEWYIRLVIVYPDDCLWCWLFYIHEFKASQRTKTRCLRTLLCFDKHWDLWHDRKSLDSPGYHLKRHTPFASDFHTSSRKLLLIFKLFIDAKIRNLTNHTCTC